ncbi:hypothetical protein GGR53DRAFT_527173 [Hypoxylon sp. FL1150]|nr:hypothetical protein GGR53DRAFT_527173 [Hypoxylon sp. FL1150]
MCQGVCWNYACRRCGTLIYKDTFVPGTAALAGHTCKKARAAGTRGCCLTGVEWQFPWRRADELCVMCELDVEMAALDADTCDEAMLEERVYADSEDEDGEEIQLGILKPTTKRVVEKDVKIDDVEIEVDNVKIKLEKTKLEDKPDRKTNHEDEKVDDQTEDQDQDQDQDGGAPLKADDEETKEDTTKEEEKTEDGGAERNWNWSRSI